MKLRAFFLLSAIFFALFIIFYLFDLLEITDTYSRFKKTWIEQDITAEGRVSGEDLTLLEREEQAKLTESFNIREAELKKKELEFAQEKMELAGRLQQVLEAEKALEKQKKRLEKQEEEIKNRQAMVKDLAEKFANMPPERAVERILEIKDDLLILDTLKEIDAYFALNGQVSSVPYLYALMPKEDAARLLRKSTVVE